MFGLNATAQARQGLRDVQHNNAELFEMVRERIGKIQPSEGPAHRSVRAFLLEDGRLARLVTFYDFVEGADLALVWVLDETVSPPAVKIVAVEHTE